MRVTAIFTIIGAIILTATTALRAADEKLDASSLKVMSYNIRNSGENDKENGWTHRREMYFSVIDKFNPDLVGFQEVLADQHDQIAERFKDYSLSGVARNDGKRKGEWACIAYRNARFDKLDEGNFWLSEHPDVPGSRSWDAALTRICSWVRLHDKVANRDFIFANTHWDHRGIEARRKAAELIKEKLPALSKKQPVILTGDFNSTEDDDWVQSLLKAKDDSQVQLFDSYREVHPKREQNEASFNGFKDVVEGERIDFILHSPELKAQTSVIDRTKSAEGRFPSDHYAVEAVLLWK